MKESERLAKVPEAFQVVVPAKLISKEVADSDGTVRAEFQLDLRCPDLGGENPEKKAWFPRCEMRFTGEFMADANTREVEKTCRERVQIDLAFGIAYQIVSDRIVILPKKDRASAAAAREMVVAIDEMSSIERKWLRLSAWVMRGLKRFFRSRPRWNTTVFFDVVTRVANEEGIDFRKYRVVPCRRSTINLDIIQFSEPILTAMPSPSKPVCRTIVLTPGDGPKSGRMKKSSVSDELMARAFWAMVEPMVRGLPVDKQTIIGIHETANELLFCVVRDAPEAS